MTWILGFMLFLIACSIAVELVLPTSIKQALGNAICWVMMAVTMGFLGLATLSLLVVTWVNFIQPMLTGSA